MMNTCRMYGAAMKKGTSSRTANRKSSTRNDRKRSTRSPRPRHKMLAQYQDCEECKKHDRVLELRSHHERSHGFQQAQDNSTHEGALDASKSAEDYHHKSTQGESRTDHRKDVVEGQQQGTGDSGQGRANCVRKNVHPIDVDPYQPRPDGVLGSGSNLFTGFRLHQERVQHESHEDEDAEADQLRQADHLP